MLNDQAGIMNPFVTPFRQLFTQVTEPDIADIVQYLNQDTFFKLNERQKEQLAQDVSLEELGHSLRNMNTLLPVQFFLCRPVSSVGGAYDSGPLLRNIQ